MAGPGLLLPAMMGAEVLGGFLTGNSQAKANKAATKENKRQFDLEFGLKKQAVGDRRSSIHQTTDIRKRIIEMLLGQMGLSGFGGGQAPAPAAMPPRGAGPLIPGAAGGGGGGGPLRPEILEQLMSLMGR